MDSDRPLLIPLDTAGKWDEQIVGGKAAKLARLSKFLDLEPGLSPRYRRFQFTGSRGDPSEMIQEGRIVTDRPQRRIELSPDDLADVQAVYEDCRTALILPSVRSTSASLGFEGHHERM